MWLHQDTYCWLGLTGSRTSGATRPCPEDNQRNGRCWSWPGTEQNRTEREWARAWLRTAATATSVRSTPLLRCDVAATPSGRSAGSLASPGCRGRPMDESKPSRVSFERLDHRRFLVLVVWRSVLYLGCNKCVFAHSVAVICSGASQRSQGAGSEWIFKCNTFLFFH